jgi:restriction system protein
VVAVIIAAVRKPSSTRFARIGAMLAAPYYPLARLGRMALKAHNDRTGAQVALKMESFDSLSGEEFEVQLGKLFQRQGYKVSATPRTGDFGADLLLKRDGEETVVQAKRYSQSVGIESVQQVIGAMAYYDVPHGMVVTNSHFTPAAHHMAQRAGIPLWDREHLAREIDQLDTTR